MRIRSLKPDFFSDRITGRWPAELALFYAGLWCLSDDEGRFEWEPELIRGQILTYRPLSDPCVLLDRLRQTGHVEKYSANGVFYGWLPKFKKHQHPNRPQESRLPDPSVSDHVPLTEPTVSAHCKRSLVVERRVRDLESSGEERSEKEEAISAAVYPRAPDQQSACQDFEAKEEIGFRLSRGLSEEELTDLGITVEAPHG